MKPVHVVAISLVLGAAIIIMPWALVFSGPLSGNPQDWGVFGDYLSGTLSTLISALALLALLFTLREQQRQIDLLVKQVNKEDLLAAIDRLERDFERCLNLYPINYVSQGVTTKFTGTDVLFNLTFANYKEVITSKEQLEEIVEKEGSIKAGDPRLLSCEMFAMAAGELNQIRLYSEQLEIVTGSNILSRYYQRKYRHPYRRLTEVGLMHTEWSEKT